MKRVEGDADEETEAHLRAVAHGRPYVLVIGAASREIDVISNTVGPAHAFAILGPATVHELMCLPELDQAVASIRTLVSKCWESIYERWPHMMLEVKDLISEETVQVGVFDVAAMRAERLGPRDDDCRWVVILMRPGSGVPDSVLLSNADGERMFRAAKHIILEE